MQALRPEVRETFNESTLQKTTASKHQMRLVRNWSRAVRTDAGDGRPRAAGTRDAARGRGHGSPGRATQQGDEAAGPLAARRPGEAVRLLAGRGTPLIHNWLCALASGSGGGGRAPTSSGEEHAPRREHTAPGLIASGTSARSASVAHARSGTVSATPPARPSLFLRGERSASGRGSRHAPHTQR